MNNKLQDELNDRVLNTDQIIALMSVYLAEWEHRDNLLWSQVFRFFYANLIVIVLPNIASFLEIDLPNINRSFFCILGMMMAVAFLYVGIGYTKRLKASSDTYKKIMRMLGKNYQRVPLKRLKSGFYFYPPLANFLIYSMFFALEAIAIALLLIDN